VGSHSQLKLGISIVILIGTLILGVGIYTLFKQREQPSQVPVASSSASVPTNPGAKKRIRVPADIEWFDTGINLTGEFIQIQYESGLWKNQPESNSCDGDGKSGYEDQAKLIVPSGLLSGGLSSLFFRLLIFPTR
jgi:hypothetical protein